MRRRGRPPKDPEEHQATKNRLVRRALELWTEHGYGAVSLEKILVQEGIPKGSFYHWFDSKSAFGEAVLTAYDDYFRAKLDRHLASDGASHLAKLAAFVEDAASGMAHHRFTRGCLVGNLSHELEGLPDGYPERLRQVLNGWERRLSHYLEGARQAQELPAEADPDELARFFWIGWEGAVMRARLERNEAPLRSFHAGFVAIARADGPRI